MFTVFTVTVIVSEKESFVMSNSTCNALLAPWPAGNRRSKSGRKGSPNAQDKSISIEKHLPIAIESVASEASPTRPSAPSRALSKLGDIWARMALSWDRPGVGVDARVAKPVVARERGTAVTRTLTKRGPAPAPWAWPNRFVSEKY